MRPDTAHQSRRRLAPRDYRSFTCGTRFHRGRCCLAPKQEPRRRRSRSGDACYSSISSVWRSSTGTPPLRREQARLAMVLGSPLAWRWSAFRRLGHRLSSARPARGDGRGRGAGARQQSGLGHRRARPHEHVLRDAGASAGRRWPRVHRYLGALDKYAADPSFDLYGGGWLGVRCATLSRSLERLFAGAVLDPRNVRRMLAPVRASGADGRGHGSPPVHGRRATCFGRNGFCGSTAVHCPTQRLTIAVS
jgi:hypothetical protein